jgi:hypothetical protein
MLRGIFALCAGLFAAMIAITGVELVMAKWLYPVPAGVDLRDAAQVQAFALSMPASAHALILSGWLLGAFAGGAVGSKLDPLYPRLPATLVGAFIGIGTMISAQQAMHPNWVYALGTVLPVPAALLAAWLVRKASPAPGK